MSEMTLSHLRSLAETVFVVLCIAAAVAGFGMTMGATAAEQRRWAPRVAAGGVALYLAIVTSLFLFGSGSRHSLIGPLLAVPVIALSALLSIMQTKYCDKCDAPQPAGSGSAPARFCPYCGAELRDAKPAPDDGYLD